MLRVLAFQIYLTVLHSAHIDFLKQLVVGLRKGESKFDMSKFEQNFCIDKL